MKTEGLEPYSQCSDSSDGGKEDPSSTLFMKPSPIKYRFAINANRRIVDVSSLTAGTRREGAPFACISCSKELIPRLGQRKVKHFAHRQETNCSRETYLHALAKLSFYQEFSECLSKGQPFLLWKFVPLICNYCEELLKVTCECDKEESIDLTKYFNRVSVEAYHDGFRADVLLSSSEHGKAVLVELNVTHECTFEKLDSSLRILEMRIEDENDIGQITRHEIHGSGKNALHNFRSRTITRHVHQGDCNKEDMHLFVVYKSGKCHLRECTIQEALKAASGGAKGTTIYCQVFEDPLHQPQDRFQPLVEDAHFAGIPVKNCFVCRYRGFSMAEAIFCKIRKEDLGSNTAADCEYYKPVKSRTEQTEVDRRIDEYNKRRP